MTTISRPSALLYETDAGVPESPPSYAAAQAAGPSTTLEDQPTNFISIDKFYGPIEDTWIIDTDIKIPEALLPSLGIFALLRTRPNLDVHTASGAIRASVILVSSSSSRAILKADTARGKMTLQVSRVGTNQPFKLSGNTNSGDIVIGIPRDYIGPLKYKTGRGRTTFSPELMTSVVKISGGLGFAGDLGNSGFVGHKSWSKDEVEVETSNGDISFMYVDEVPEDGPSSKGAVTLGLKAALGWIGSAETQTFMMPLLLIAFILGMLASFLIAFVTLGSNGGRVRRAQYQYQVRCC